MSILTLTVDPKKKGCVSFDYYNQELYLVKVDYTTNRACGWCISKDPEGVECWLEYHGQQWMWLGKLALTQAQWDKVRTYSIDDLLHTLNHTFDMSLTHHGLRERLCVSATPIMDRVGSTRGIQGGQGSISIS